MAVGMRPSPPDHGPAALQAQYSPRTVRAKSAPPQYRRRGLPCGSSCACCVALDSPCLRAGSKTKGRWRLAAAVARHDCHTQWNFAPPDRQPSSIHTVGGTKARAAGVGFANT